MALLDEEFQRLQTQFLELKTSNYSLEDSIKRKDNEISALRIKNEEMEKELSKLHKMVKFNPFAKKEMKDSEVIDSLQRKIDHQEEEFKRTNETLKMEISSLMKANSQLRDKLIEVGIEDFECDVNCYESNLKQNYSNDMNGESNEGDLGTCKRSSNSCSINSSPMKYAILAEKELLENKVLDLEDKVQKLTKSKSDLENKLEETSMMLESLKEQLSESENLCTQRKCLIDEMKEHINETSSKHFTEIEAFNQKYEAALQDLNAKIVTIESDAKEIQDLQSEIQQLTESRESDRLQMESLRKELDDSHSEVSMCRSVCDSRIKEIELEKERALVLMTETSSLEVQEMKQLAAAKEEEVNLLKKEVENLTRKIDDSVEERKIHERKGLMMVKELKKQLASEKKRNEMLQEKLSQVLSESSNVHELELSSSSHQNANHSNNDNASIGSWSFVPGANKIGHRRTSSMQSGSTEKDISPANSGSLSAANESTTSANNNLSILESENSQLVSKITSMQEEKWMMEEKMNQLHKAIDKLSLENESKSQIIKFYCMEGRSDASTSSASSSSSSINRSSDKLTVKKVVDFIKDRGDENLKEINRKLQRMLEETLIKNMHLHQDLERLSDQLVLAKGSGPAASVP